MKNGAINQFAGKKGEEERYRDEMSLKKTNANKSAPHFLQVENIALCIFYYSFISDRKKKQNKLKTLSLFSKSSFFFVVTGNTAFRSPPSQIPFGFNLKNQNAFYKKKRERKTFELLFYITQFLRVKKAEM